jgi:glycosyltransferase involved in cell wall biosynthesis
VNKPRILLLASHAVAEYDDIRMFTDRGYEVFCPGGYQDPRVGIEGMRPGIPNAPVYPELIAACDARRAERGDPGDYIDWAKADIPDAVWDWAEVIICHHFPERWLPQIIRRGGKRVIWRTCGQSNPYLEAFMTPMRSKLEIVRYSPKERNLPNYAGEDAVIRFGKYPNDYLPWTGEQAVVGNVTQHMLQRGDACGYPFWKAATDGLVARPAGPGSEEIGGLGNLTYDQMRLYLSQCRAYLYTGTQPASYTLGLIEAMLTGVPVVSIGPRAFGPGWVGDVFEGHEISWPSVRISPDVAVSRVSMWFDLNDPSYARSYLRQLLSNEGGFADRMSAEQRQRAIDLFDVATVGKQWDELLCAS